MTIGAGDTYRMPAEWEEDEAIWMSWPTYDSVRGYRKDLVYVEIFKALAGRVKVRLLVQREEVIGEVRSLLEQHGVSHRHVEFFIVPYQDIWMRDIGPTFIWNARGDVFIADFSFDSWGYRGYSSGKVWDEEERVDRLIATKLRLPTVPSNIVHEGGAIEHNGKGTLITVESLLKRYSGLTKRDVEEEEHRLLGIKKVIWLERGVPEDDLTFDGVLPGGVFTAITTGGHTDEFVRFADERTILLAEVTEEDAASDPICAIGRERLERAYAQLSKETDQDGNPFRILRVPCPDPIYVEMSAGDATFDFLATLRFNDGTVIDPKGKIKVIMAASYQNYLVTNGVVLAQTYYKPGRPESTKRKDAAMKRILAEVFPGREVVGINAEALNLGGGGIHCITQQQPVRG